MKPPFTRATLMDGSNFFFEKQSTKEYSCEIILKSNQRFLRKRCFLRISSCPYSAKSPHSPEPCFGTDQKFANSF